MKRTRTWQTKGASAVVLMFIPWAVGVITIAVLLVRGIQETL